MSLSFSFSFHLFGFSWGVVGGVVCGFLLLLFVGFCCCCLGFVFWFLVFFW